MNKLKRPTNLLPTPSEYGIDIHDVASHHSLPDMIHRFPTAAEYERLNRKRETRKRRIILAVGVLAGVILIAAIFPNRSSKHSVKESIVHHVGYIVGQATYLQEIQADIVTYYHKTTRTEVMTLVPHDAEQDSVFGISFRTLPESDNGAAHILMRSVLDGSKKFPLKDPFEELKRGSLQTYLKQFVFEDRTIYTCASRNKKDFANLVSVYLDAVFDPNVLRDNGNWIFRQEGWRVEKYSHNNPHSKQQHHYNGVVFETQKGTYSDPDACMFKYAHRALFPNTSYQYDNSGRPSEILTLTRNALIDYHRKYYHPTNAQVFLYGSTEDVAEALNQVDDYVAALDYREDLKDQSMPKWQSKIFTDPAPREVHEYPSSSSNGDFRVMMTWLVNDEPLNAKTEFAWRMLNYLLIGSPTGALRKRLEASGDGREVIGGGLRADLLQWTFSVGMKGVESFEVKDVEDQIMDTLIEISKMDGGFNSEEMEAAFNSVEFQLTDHGTGALPRGISFMFKAFAKWNYDGHLAEEAFEFAQGIEDLVADVEQHGAAFFMQLLKDGLIANSHKVVVVLSPDNLFVSNQIKDEESRLDLLRSSVSDEEFFKIIDETGEMNLKQKLDDPTAVINTIPHLTIDDIEPITRPNGVKLRIAENMLLAETSVVSSFGILYIDFGLDLGNVDFDDVPLLPLLCRLFLESGTKLLTEEQLNTALGRVSGGIVTKILVEGVRPKGTDGVSFAVTDESHFATKLFFRGKCLSEKLPEYFELLGGIIWFGAEFNQAKTVEILDDMLAVLTENVGKNGHDFVARRIESRYSNYGFIRERLEGIASLQKLTEARNSAANDWDNFKARLIRMRKAIVQGHRNGMVLSMTGEQDELDTAQSQVTVFTKDIVPDNDHATPFTHPSTDVHPWLSQMMTEQSQSPKIVNEGIQYPALISHVGVGARLYEVDQPINGAASVVSKYLEDGYLHEMVNIQGGAADVQCRLDYKSGTLKFVSYRDPHVAKTIDVFNNADTFLGQSILNTETLPEEAIHAIIGTIADLDGSSPQPDKIGWDFLIEYIREDSSDFRQLWRDQILNTSRADFESYIKRLSNWAEPSIAVIASTEAMQDANATRNIQLQPVHIDID